MYLRMFLSSLIVFVLGATLPADAKILKKGVCVNQEMCNWYKHPRPRVLKPIACIPLRFDQWHPGTVTIRIDYSDGRPPKFDSKPAGFTGQYCRGESIWRGGSVCVCNTENFATLNAAEVADGVARARFRNRHSGWTVTLKGSAWGTARGARQETVPCQVLPKS